MPVTDHEGWAFLRAIAIQPEPVPTSKTFKAFPSGRVWVGSFDYPHEEAKNAERALDTIRTQLAKLGDTPYIARSVQIDSRPYFIPISILNQWRRETL